MLSGELTSFEIVSFYGDRCYKYGRKYNLLTEEYYEDALTLAKQRD